MLTTALRSTLYRLPEGFQRKVHWRLRRLRFLRSHYHFERRWAAFSGMGFEERRQWILSRVRAVALHAQNTNPFYRQYYCESGFDAADLASFEDLEAIPIVTKELLRDAHAEWLQPDARTSFANTGGTSGSPLRFCTDKRIWAKEDYHIDRVWQRAGCSRRDGRAVFRGLNLGMEPWVYFPSDDAHYINTYRSYTETEEALRELFMTRKIEFLHGYPSAIYQFALRCLEPGLADLRHAVTRNLRGVLLGSEYPPPQFRAVIEEAFHVRTLSWYGHSEMAVLAAERDGHGLYEPLHTYGYTEAVPNGTGTHQLLGTSFDNLRSPFIRYDTGDSVEPVQQAAGLLLSFRVAAGRIGEFVLDRKGTAISLTSLVFGRHHAAFDRADFIQVSQDRPGVATLHVTTRHDVSVNELAEWFDTGNVEIEFDYLSRRHPWRSAQGKVALLIPSEAGAPSR